jgi:hypothetical protein
MSNIIQAQFCTIEEAAALLAATLGEVYFLQLGSVGSGSSGDPTSGDSRHLHAATRNFENFDKISGILGIGYCYSQSSV